MCDHGHLIANYLFIQPIKAVFGETNVYNLINRMNITYIMIFIDNSNPECDLS